MNVRDCDEPSTHRSLLQRAADGNDDGWRMMVQVYGPLVYGWIRRCGVQSADAADVMQETFLAVSKSLARFDADTAGSSFRGWLWTIAKHKLRDRQRAIARSAAGDSPSFLWETLESPEPPSEFGDDVRSVRIRMLEVLRSSIDPRSWQMFWRTAVDGCDPGDVAEEMNVTRWAVYKARARVLQRLKTEMQDFGN
ncbi:RNA polymerase sigma factor CnrH [Rubripirellula lacrimiformis]|uniref:RNA polymerase sigma factor CnrH n=1 Tax=Rubripirellula lacrimiformis TaxID=1930273 RepID=A0A517N7M0_9BACT|nr:sigma-70 family RNA polymerase sigma factor [Rubripirellula lacrimiformis]QDT02988.1 RNA polymerase sigma factor CnrH [Rubripirellula lacrimiformis]